MDQAATVSPPAAGVAGPPRFNHLDHVSMPCRDLEEAIRFYRDVLGGEILVTEQAFALFRIAGMRVGIGSAGCSFMTPQAEYPHIAFNADADALERMESWLAACGIPTSGFWTRKGIETLMFFRDPSGNVIELFCDGGFESASGLPRGPARGHGTTLDIDALAYTEWRLPGDDNPVASQGKT